MNVPMHPHECADAPAWMWRCTRIDVQMKPHECGDVKRALVPEIFSVVDPRPTEDGEADVGDGFEGGDGA